MRTRKIITYVLSLLLLITMTGSSFVFADSGYDNTAPVIKRITIQNPDRLGQSDYMTAAIDLIEDGVGVKSIILDFYNKEEGHQPSIIYQCDEPGAPDQELLFTGKHNIRFYIGDRFYKGKYELRGMSITDQNGNETVYEKEKKPQNSVWKYATNSITVVKGGMTDKTAPAISNFKINNAKNVNASENLSVTFDLVETESGCRDVSLVLRNAQGHERELRWNAEIEMLYSGRHTVSIPIKGVLVRGEYKLRQLYVSDSCNNYNCYENLSQSLVVTSSKLTDVTDPVIKRANIESSKLNTPGLLPVTFDFVEDGDGINNITIELTNTKSGKTKQLAWYGNGHPNSTSDRTYKTGTYTIAFPVNPFWGQGEYKVNWICVGDKAGNNRFFQNEELFANGSENDKVTVSSGFDIGYYGSLGNEKAVEGVKALKQGETAVLDCRMVTKAKKELFNAIAGKNKTIVFEDENVQWVFNGKNVLISKCKDINLSSQVKTVSGAAEGYPDESKIVKIVFPNNGTLPGKADIRVNNAYITQKYADSDKNMVLSYVEQGSPKIEATGVECADDHYAEFNVKHNSSFILSQTKARLVAPSSLKASNNGVNSVKLSWKKVPGARGYMIYRSTSSSGKYTLVGKVTNKTQSWKDSKLKSNKQYYYKVKAYGSDKATAAQFSKAVAMRTTPPKQIISLKTTKRAIKVNWKGDYQRASGYQIIYANNSRFKNKKTVQVKNKYENKYTIKSVKSGKIYYVKVRSYKASKGKIIYGAYSDSKKIRVK